MARLSRWVEPDAVVDVHAVRRIADDGHAGAGVGEDLRRDAGCGAVRAVEHDVDAVEPVREAGQQVEDVAVLGVREAADAADIGPGRGQLVEFEVLLDAVFDDVGKLGAPAGEDLDPVVGSGVVRRRDHHTEVGVEVGDQERGGRGGDDSRVVDVDARAGEPGRDGGGEELARDARVSGDDGLRALAGGAPRLGATALRQYSSS